MIKFIAGKNGPKFNVGNATFTFKPIDSKAFSRWYFLNSDLTSQDLEGYKSGEAKAHHKMVLNTAKFVADMMVDIKGLQDDESKEFVVLGDLTYDDRCRLAESLIEHEGFGDWLDKYRAGTEKKSSPMA